MRVITAIYLYVKPGLRDEWLSQSGEGEGDGENSLAMERAVRSLAFWYNVRRYPDETGMVQEGGDSSLDVGEVQGLSNDVAAEEVEGEVDPNDDDVNPLDLGAPPSPPPELEMEQRRVSSPAGESTTTSTATNNINTETTSTSQYTTFADHHTRTPSTTSTSSTTSRLATHHPDFFTQELERMSLTKDPKTGFWSRSAHVPAPYSPYAEQMQAQMVQAQQQG